MTSKPAQMTSKPAQALITSHISTKHESFTKETLINLGKHTET